MEFSIVKQDRGVHQFLILILIIGHARAICPSQCICERWDEIVDCSNQNLLTVPPSIQVNATEIILTGNRLNTLDDWEFSKFTRLSKLDLSNNSVSSIARSAFNGLESLTRLDLLGNQLPEILMGTFNDTRNLVNLDLSYNRLDGLPAELFHACTMLAQLRLAGNRLTQTVFSAIDRVPWLQTLELSSNPLGRIEYLSFSRMYSLTILELSDCAISSVDNNAFVGLTSLNILYLNRNNIPELRREIFQPLGDLVDLNIASNPLRCDCGTKQFKDWREESSVTVNHKLTCTEGGREVDILNSDLGFLCSTNPAPGACDNTTQQVTMRLVNESSISLHWDKQRFGSVQTLQITVRYFSDDKIIFKGSAPVADEMVFVPVTRATQTGVVVCVDAGACRWSQEFVINAAPSSSNFIVVAVVGAVLGVCVLILLALLIWAVVMAKRKRALYKTNTPKQGITPPNTTNPRNQSVDLGDINPYEAIPVDRLDPRRSVHMMSNGYPVAFSNKGYLEEGQSQARGGAPNGVVSPHRPLPPDQYLHTMPTFPRERQNSPRPTTGELLDATTLHHPGSSMRRPSDHKYEEPTFHRPRTVTEYEEPQGNKLQLDVSVSKSMSALDSLDTPIPAPPHYMALDVRARESDSGADMDEYYNRSPLSLQRHSGQSNLAAQTPRALSQPHLGKEEEESDYVGSDYQGSEYLKMNGRVPSEYLDMRPASNC